MFEDIRSYFVRNVLANYKDFRKQIKSRVYGLDSDVRLALNVASPLYHMREHIPKNHRKSRSEISKECPEYDLLGDIVNASKHKELNQNKPKLKKASAIKETLVSTEYEDEEGKFHDIEKKVYAILDSGEEIDLQKILLTVINFWIDELKTIGISYRKFNPIIKKTPLSRTSLENPPKLDLQAIRGEKFDFQMRFMKYDYQKGKIIPKDISNHDFNLKIYRPEFTGAISMRNKKTGNKIEIDFPITAEQVEKLQSIKDKELEQLYLNSILQNSEEFIEKLKKIHNNQ